MKIKCMIVDDEPLAIKLVQNHISKVESLEVVATCNTPMKAFEVLNRQEVDLLFLDINMPDMTGLDFLRTIKNPPKTILTTAHREFALEGYDLDVVDYLLKPITFDRFFKAVNRFISKEKVVKAVSDVNEEEFILVKSGTKFHKILLNQIIYGESFKDYVKIHTSEGEEITSKNRISSLQVELERSFFKRVHRSFIINVNKIKAFTVHDIDVGGFEIPIGASYKDAVFELLNELKS